MIRTTQGKERRKSIGHITKTNDPPAGGAPTENLRRCGSLACSSLFFASLPPIVPPPCTPAQRLPCQLHAVSPCIAPLSYPSCPSLTSAPPPNTHTGTYNLPTTTFQALTPFLTTGGGKKSKG